MPTGALLDKVLGPLPGSPRKGEEGRSDNLASVHVSA